MQKVLKKAQEEKKITTHERFNEVLRYDTNK